MAKKAALVVVDMLNPYDFEDADVPVIYGDGNSSQEELARRALEGERPDLVEPLLPPDGLVAHIHEDLREAALKMMERNMDAQLAPSERAL